MNNKLMFKKVTGERLVAAIIDNIISGILTSIPVFIHGLVVFLQSNGTFMDFIEDYMSSLIVNEMGEVNPTYMLIIGLSGFIIGFLYYVYIPFKSNGQTWGKKIMSIKAIDEFGNNPTLKQHTLRAVQMWSTYASTITLPLILIMPYLGYSVIVTGLTSVTGLLVFVSFIMILAKDDGRGLHDSLAGSFVVKADVDLDQMFIEKGAQMSDWADVDFNVKDSKSNQTAQDDEDDWVI